MFFIPWLKRIEYVTINVNNVNMFVTNTLSQPTCPCRALEGKMWAMWARAGKPKP